jgi:GH25 family lysozyme M1 (1,4-beta-N-acetylmuramidase)
VNYPLVTDVSLWNTLNYDILAQNLRGAIVKSGQGEFTDPKFYRHVAGFASVGLPIGTYYWLDPMRDPIQQADHAISLAQEANASFIAMDYEQWWLYWSEWYAWRRGKLPGNKVKVIPTKQINSAGKRFIEQTSKAIKSVFYSSPGYITSYVPAAKEWMFDYSTWMARYLSLKVLRIDWPALPKHYPINPSLFFGHLPDMWQWTGDRIALPGSDGYWDLNFIMTPEFDQYFPPKEIVPLPYDVYRLKKGVTGLNVRAGKGTNFRVIRVIIPSEDIILEKNQKDTWVKLYGEEGYIHSYYIEPKI